MRNGELELEGADGVATTSRGRGLLAGLLGALPLRRRGTAQVQVGCETVSRTRSEVRPHLLHLFTTSDHMRFAVPLALFGKDYVSWA